MKNFSVAFASSGGMGNLVIHANFVKAFRQRFSKYDFEINIFGHPFKNVNEAVFFGQDWVDHVYTNDAPERNISHNAFINLHFYPQVWVCDPMLAKLAPEVHDLLMAWKKEIRDNKQKNYFHTNYNYNINAIWEGINKGSTCLNSCDITGELGIGREYNLEVFTKKSSLSVLHNCGLAHKKFITLQRGLNPFAIAKETPRLWPLEHYNKLISLLKAAFPDITLVQVGGSKKRCAEMEGVDMNLVGRTDLEDLKALLKEAWLHIDAECGMVHLRKALHAGPSVVMYGQTPKAFYSYPGNINLSTDACAVPCARLTDDWQWRCARGCAKAVCMHSITPEMALSAIKRYAATGSVDEHTPTLYDQILADERFKLDEEWASRWLADNVLLHYDVARIALKDIWVTVFEPRHGWARLPLDCSPVYRQLICQDDSYARYLELVEANGIFNEHTLDGFSRTIERFTRGFDSRYMPVLNGRYNEILDGQHRAAWLLYKHGPDYPVDVVRIWCTK